MEMSRLRIGRYIINIEDDSAIKHGKTIYRRRYRNTYANRKLNVLDIFLFFIIMSCMGIKRFVIMISICII